MCQAIGQGVGASTTTDKGDTMSTTQTESGEDIGRRITEHVTRLGLSFPRLGRLVYERIGAYTPNDETLRTWAKGKANPEKIDPLVITAMADVFGCTVADISVIAAQTLNRVNGLLARTALAADDATLDEPVLPAASPVVRLHGSRCDSLGAQRPLPFDDASVTDVEVSWPSEGTGSVTYVTDLLASPEELARVYAGADLDIRSDHVLVGAA
jgi:hypothetical protein